MSQKHWQSNQFCISHDMATQLTGHEFKAAPGAGFAIYITDIELYMGGTQRAVSLLSGSTTMWTAAPAASGQATAHFNVPIKLTANEALNCTSAGASTGAWIVVNGFVGRA